MEKEHQRVLNNYNRIQEETNNFKLTILDLETSVKEF